MMPALPYRLRLRKDADESVVPLNDRSVVAVEGDTVLKPVKTPKFEITLDPKHVESMRDVERKYLLAVLGLVGDNKTAAAKLLCISRKTLYRKLGLLKE